LEWQTREKKEGVCVTCPGLCSLPLVFLGFALFWMWGVPGGAPGFFGLFGLLFVAGGFAIISCPLIWQLLRHPNTEYLITDRRVITQSKAIGLDTRFVDFDKIQEVYVKIGNFAKLYGTGSSYALTAGSSRLVPQ